MDLGTVWDHVATPPFNGTLRFVPDGRVLAQNRDGAALLYAAGRVLARLPVADGGGAFRADSDELVAVVTVHPGLGVTVARFDEAGMMPPTVDVWRRCRSWVATRRSRRMAAGWSPTAC